MLFYGLKVFTLISMYRTARTDSMQPIFFCEGQKISFLSTALSSLTRNMGHPSHVVADCPRANVPWNVGDF